MQLVWEIVCILKKTLLISKNGYEHADFQLLVNIHKTQPTQDLGSYRQWPAAGPQVQAVMLCASMPFALSLAPPLTSFMGVICVALWLFEHADFPSKASLPTPLSHLSLLCSTVRPIGL